MSAHVHLYGKPFQWLNDMLGDNRMSIIKPEQLTKTQEYVSACFVPLTFLPAMFVGLILFVAGCVALIFSPIVLFVWLSCLCIGENVKHLGEFFGPVFVMIVGGIVTMLWAILLLVIWPCLMIVRARQYKQDKEAEYVPMSSITGPSIV